MNEHADEKKPVKKSRGVGFAAMQAFMNQATEPTITPTQPIGSPLESPALRRVTAERAQSKEGVFRLALPVSKQVLEMAYMELDPRECIPSPLNPRDQSLLSLDDPEVARIKESFEREGQREPAKVRAVMSADGTTKWEVVEGTTRLFISRALTEEQGRVVSLKAWVGPIPDADIRRLAKAENRDRRDLSPWETARALREDARSLYKGRSQDYIAEQEGWSQTQVSNLLKLADLDIRLVRLVASPSHISLSAGLQLASVWNDIPVAEHDDALTALQEGVPFADAAAVVRALKMYKTGRAKTTPPKARPLLAQTKAGEVIAKLSPHRTSAGQYKLDLFGFTQGDAARVMEFIQKIRGG